ncbi:MAG TPA: pilus assembly protein TadG-related protein [Mycobacteriales bacterium]|jgi:Flp pilus assembly protein TadG|nr:pilus assembly protein TadG-related protein [Mycobacteriales bacterium]
MRLKCEDGGSIMVLVIGYAAIAFVLVAAGIDVSKVFLAQRALSSAADAAAVAAAEGVDTAQIYDGPDLECGKALPLDQSLADSRARYDIATESPDLARAFASLAPPATTVSGATATVSLRGQVRVPFGQLLQWLGIAGSNGTVAVAARASATSPISGSIASC